MELRSVTRLGLLLALIGLVGCSSVRARAVVLHPIEKSDIFSVPATAEIKIKAGTEIRDPKTDVVLERWEEDTTMTVEKDGWFLSDFYLTEVSQAKVGK
jgi:hypothetical protein